MIKCKLASESVCGKTCCCADCTEPWVHVCDRYKHDGYDPLTCSQAFTEKNSLVAMKTAAATIIQAISDIVTKKKDLEEQEKTMKEQLQKAMEQYGVKSFDNDIIKVTYIAPSVRNSVDSAKLKKNYPEIATECSKTSLVKAFVKIEVK